MPRFKLWLLLLSGVIFPAMAASPSTTATATFAGGCFWCMQSEFSHHPAVLSTVVGYTGGHVKNPTYQQVGAGGTGHREALQITYDPTQITYAELLNMFWSNIDPLDATGQFCDQGDQYKSAIYYHTPAQQQAATASKEKLAKKLKKQVVTDIFKASTFYPAEEYHQQYHEKNPFKYRLYRSGCGRDGRLNDLKTLQNASPEAE